MLKIKDNVDLKELEQFGFVKTNKYSYELPLFRDNLVGLYFWKRPNGGWMLSVDTSPRDATSYGISERLDTIYDLIQAGLVEKE